MPRLEEPQTELAPISLLWFSVLVRIVHILVLLKVLCVGF